MIKVLYILLSIFCHHSKAQDMSEKTIDHYLGDRYEFNLFENAEECARVYKNESKVLDHLLSIKQKLLKLKKCCKDKENIRKTRELLITSANDIKAEKSSLKMITNGFPMENDFMGSIKAMFLLHYTHYINMTLAVTDGLLSFINDKDEEISFQVSKVN